MGRTRSTVVRRAVIGVLAALTPILMRPPAAGAAGAPDLTVTKASNAAAAVHVGDIFTYTIEVVSDGTGTAHDVEMGDDLPVGVRPVTIVPSFPGGTCAVTSSQDSDGPPHASVFCQRAALPAGTTAAVSFDVTLTRDVSCGELVNVARVAASDEPDAATGNNEGRVTDDVTCPPSVSITKTARSYAHVGDDITMTMKVRNTGPLDLLDVDVVDPGCDGSPAIIADGDGDQTLAVGETWVYRCRTLITASAGDRVASRARVTANSTAGRVWASDRASVRVLRPALTLRVTPDPISGTPGETVTYRYVLRNTGNATLTGISIDDDRLGHIGDVARLAPGHAVTVSVERILSARRVWVVNVATATGTDPGDERVTASDRAAVTIVAPNGGPAPGAGGDGTAFTGSRATAPAIVATVLFMLGISSLLAARRRRS